MIDCGNEKGTIELKVLAFTLLVAAAVWLVLAAIGARESQELYGGSSGFQLVLLGVAIGLIPASLGLWAYRRARERGERSLTAANGDSYTSIPSHLVSRHLTSLAPQPPHSPIDAHRFP